MHVSQQNIRRKRLVEVVLMLIQVFQAKFHTFTELIFFLFSYLLCILSYACFIVSEFEFKEE